MFANRPIHFSNFWNICKTKSGKLVTGEGGFQIRKWGVRQKIKKSISRGRGVGGEGSIIWKWRVIITDFIFLWCIGKSFHFHFSCKIPQIRIRHQARNILQTSSSSLSWSYYWSPSWCSLPGSFCNSLCWVFCCAYIP